MSRLVWVFVNYEGVGTMMQLARRTSLVVVLLVLTSVATASAECARVLWSAKWDHQANDYRYRYVDSFTTKPGCDDEAAFRNRNIKEARERDRPLIVPMGILQCVPDTIDPRGPKGR